MGRQRNNPQTKVNEELSERMLNEIEASQQSDTEFKNNGYKEAQRPQ